MRPQLLDRLILPLAIPVAIAVTIAFILIGMSRILLAMPKDLAPPVALTVALVVLLASAYLATHPVSRETLRVFIAIPVLFLAVGGVLGQMRWNDKQNEHGAEAA